MIAGLTETLSVVAKLALAQYALEFIRVEACGSASEATTEAIMRAQLGECFAAASIVRAVITGEEAVT